MARETILLRGHIIDSLLLPKVLDVILQFGGTFQIADVRIGQTRQEPSSARIVIEAETREKLSQILAEVRAHGGMVEEQTDCAWVAAPAAGVFPDDFYATTNLVTEVRVLRQWLPVSGIEMDLGIRVNMDKSGAPTASTVPMAEVKKGDRIVVGREGIRVVPLERPAK